MPGRRGPPLECGDVVIHLAEVHVVDPRLIGELSSDLDIDGLGRTHIEMETSGAHQSAHGLPCRRLPAEVGKSGQGDAPC